MFIRIKCLISGNSRRAIQVFPPLPTGGTHETKICRCWVALVRRHRIGSGIRMVCRMPTRFRTSSTYAGSAIRGVAVGGGQTTIAPTASIPCHASAISIGVIAAGAGGNLPGAPAPFLLNWLALPGLPYSKNFISPLETKSGFYNFPVATAGWSGRLMGPGT